MNYRIITNLWRKEKLLTSNKLSTFYNVPKWRKESMTTKAGCYFDDVFSFLSHVNLAPITISEWSEQFDFKEDDATSPVSPDDFPADQIKSETILLDHAPEYASKGNPNWETLFESDKPSELSKASKNNEDDLLQLQQVFQSQVSLPKESRILIADCLLI